MKLLAPAILALLVSTGIAGYFGGFIPYSFQLAPAPQIVPVVYAPAGDAPANTTFNTQTFGDVVVYMYWADWNHHGPTANAFNTEPVFVYYLGSSQQPFAEAQRVHYQWRVKFTGIVMQGTTHPVWSYVTDYDIPYLGNPPIGTNVTLVTTPWVNAPQPVDDCGISGPCPVPIDPMAIIGYQAQAERALIFGAGSFAAIFVVGLTLVNSVLPKWRRK